MHHTRTYSGFSEGASFREKSEVPVKVASIVIDCPSLLNYRIRAEATGTLTLRHHLIRATVEAGSDSFVLEIGSDVKNASS